MARIRWRQIRARLEGDSALYERLRAEELSREGQLFGEEDSEGPAATGVDPTFRW